MKKETIIRQNPCDQEMNVLLLVSFSLFMAMELLGGGTGMSLWADRLIRAACLVTAPGFFLLLGYGFHRNIRTQTEEETKAWLLRSAAGCGLIFLFLAFGQVFAERMPVKDSVVEILTAVNVPSASAIFCSLTVLLIMVWALFPTVSRIAGSDRASVIFSGICLLTTLLQTGEESYTFMEVLFGTKELISVPVLAYFAYFLAGAWLEREKPAFQWKTALISLGMTGGAAVLYLTPLRPAALALISVFPLYLIYAAAEWMTEITLRFQTVRNGYKLLWPVFWIYAVVLFLLGRKQFMAEASVWKILIVSAVLLAGTTLAAVCWTIFVQLYEKAENWFAYKVRRKTAVYFLGYTAAFSAVLFLVFFEFVRTGSTFIIKGDGVVQYYPRVVYYSRYIRELVSGIMQGNFTLPMYDFGIGLGTEITYSMEPLYLLYALFGEEHLEFAYNLVTVLRFYFAGIAMSVLCLYFRKGYFQSFLASVVYVASGFALYGGVMHTNFMIPMILLPLQILAIEEILRKKRWYLCTIITAVALFSNYYFLYMNTIAMGIYFLVRFFSREKKEDRTLSQFIQRGLVICGSYLLGVGMSCIVLVTTFGMYLGSGRGGALIKTPSLFYYSAEWLISCFMTFLTTANSPGEWLKLGYLPIAMIALVFLFMRRGRRELKLFSVLAVLFMAFPAAGFVFSGFSTVTNRWCYMVALLAAYLVAECYEEMRSMNARDLKVCGILTLIYGFLAYYGVYKSTRYTKFAFWLLAATLAVLVICQIDRKSIRETTKKGLLLLLTCGIVAYQGYSLYHMDGMVKGYAAKGETQELITATPLAAVEELEDDSFYRVADPKARYNSSNASFLLDYNSNTLLCSVYNGNIMEYLKKMGCTSYTSIRLSGMDNRVFLDQAAAVKYYAAYDKQDTKPPYGAEELLKTKVNEKKTTVYENKYALPMGYTYDADAVLSEEELEAYPTVQRQEVLMQQVMLDISKKKAGKKEIEKTDTAVSKNLDVMLTSEVLDYEVSKCEGLKLEEHALTAYKEEKKESEDAVHKMTLRFESLPESEVYLVLENAFLEGDMSEQEITISVTADGRKASYAFRPDDFRYHTGQEDYVINLGYFAEPITSCEVAFDREGSIQFERLELWNQSMESVGAYTAALTEDILEDVTIETNRVSGKISLDQEKILVLSIPYQKGWKAFVDGQETEILQANYMYMALPLEAGEHTIELTFEIPGVYKAFAIMAGSAILFVLLCFVWAVRKGIENHGKKKRDRKKERDNEQESVEPGPEPGTESGPESGQEQEGSLQ